ncbi:MAG: hypothetical protein B7Z80_18115 [Rhodospirillales bacterium 20-64-7]|nr:MAG: hypothetical protein B7Z80_18115 [Rhodospirillales bacterium 20-64-7]
MTWRALPISQRHRCLSRMLNSGDWQAIAEVLGVILVILNGLGGMFLYRMQASFVTRGEHNTMGGRVSAVEDEIDTVKLNIGKLVTTEEMSALYTRLSAVEQNTATIAGRLAGISEQVGATNHMLNLLVKSGLEGSKRT